MNDVQHGGSTVFPKLGVAARPSKGAVLFWDNLYPSGLKDPYAFHGGCPLIYGIKWGKKRFGTTCNCFNLKSFPSVANKWIREFGQTFVRPCGLKPETGIPSQWVMKTKEW